MKNYKSLYPSIRDKGFTLVELSIVMIIIGLLIGGVFGGIRLIENANIQRTIKDFKSIDSAAISFRDTYGRLPGDLINPSTRLPNCTTAPCSVSGNGDRGLTPLETTYIDSAITNTDERFLFWHHLQAADMIQMGFTNTNDMNFGEGQPPAAEGGGYRFRHYFTGQFTNSQNVDSKHILMITGIASAALNSDITLHRSTSCNFAAAVDRKMDDNIPRSGKLIVQSLCNQSGVDDSSPYSINNNMTALNYINAF